METLTQMKARRNEVRCETERSAAGHSGVMIKGVPVTRLLPDRHQSYICLSAAIDEPTASALFFTSAISSSFNGNSSTRSTPPAPRTHGTPK